MRQIELNTGMARGRPDLCPQARPVLVVSLVVSVPALLMLIIDVTVAVKTQQYKVRRRNWFLVSPGINMVPVIHECSSTELK